MVCSDEGEAGKLAGDLEILLGEGETPCRVGRLFARELFVRAGTVISRQWEHNRIAVLYELSGRISACNSCFIGLSSTQKRTLNAGKGPRPRLREGVCQKNYDLFSRWAAMVISILPGFCAFVKGKREVFWGLCGPAAVRPPSPDWAASTAPRSPEPSPSGPDGPW